MLLRVSGSPFVGYDEHKKRPSEEEMRQRYEIIAFPWLFLFDVLICLSLDVIGSNFFLLFKFSLSTADTCYGCMDHLLFERCK